MTRFVPAALTPRRLVVLGIALVVFGVVGYLVLTALLARRDLTEAKAELSIVKARLLAGDRNGANAELVAADRNAAAARSHTGGPIWSIAAALPWVGAPLETIRGIAVNADDLTSSTLPRIADIARTLSPDRLRLAPDQIDVSRLRRSAPTLQAVNSQTATVVDHVRALPGGTWLGPVNRARTQFLDLVSGLRDTLDTAAVASRTLPSMLGADGDRRYLLVIQTNAESRGLGGLPGVYAVMQASHGKVSFEKFGNDSDITSHAHVPLPAATAQWYDNFGVQQLWVNSNMSPDLPTDARIWASYWQQQTGEHIDGAVATDPVALSYLLRVTGGFTAADGTRVTGDNFVQLIESTVYDRYRDVAQRKKFFIDVGRAAADQVLHGAGGHAHDLLDAFARAVDERRLLVWSAHADEEGILAAHPIGGVLPSGPGRFFAVVVNNGAGDKLDYYLGRSISYVGGDCSAGRRAVTATITFRNEAPTYGLPPYVVVRSDNPITFPPPGTNRELVTIYATRGSRLVGLTVDGQPPQQVSPAAEAGHPMWSMAFDIRPQRSVVVRARLSEPVVPGPVGTLRQPLVLPLDQRIDPGPDC